MHEWKYSWTTNTSKIFSLSLINLTLTVLSEILVRDVISIYNTDIIVRFISSEGISIQGAINCLNTLIISLAGAPILFFDRIKDRYILFVLFGLLTSLISQLTVSIVFNQALLLYYKRIIFDLVYLATIKFISFEFFRPKILLRNKLYQLYLVRIGQDLTQTLFKISMLILIGLRN